MTGIDDLLRLTVEKGASDLHVKAGSPPCVRIHTRLHVLREMPPVSAQACYELAQSMLNDAQVNQLDRGEELDFAYSLAGVGRFRVNIFRQRGSVEMAFRHVTHERPSFEELGLPQVVRTLSEEPRGLVLVTGTAGSGKTTTLAAMIDHINRTRDAHVVTIEDPIEVLHHDDQALISQREIGIDTESYGTALRHVVRQDPDVILIGEMRDEETVRAALTAAEIGNLVLSTLHTIDATETINRIIDFFPPYQQKQVRLMLASTLKGIISMRLLPRLDGGLVPAVEVMVNTGTTKEYIANEQETMKIKEAIEEGDYYGMQSFDQSLIDLYRRKLIGLDDAVAMAAHAHDFKLKIQQLGPLDDDDFLPI
ncbi:MAG: PilT/PilU family type 4a pilus ATPase [Actinobacteria bacterium]|nr:MAG: PilT/PilU family type 4a pilus ATPase [Actinomycetota bacterium]